MNEETEVEGVKISQLPKANAINGSSVVAGVVDGVTSAIPTSLFGGSTNQKAMTIQQFNELWEKA